MMHVALFFKAIKYLPKDNKALGIISPHEVNLRAKRETLWLF